MDTTSIATTFLTTCALDDPKKAFEMFVSADFIHHNQYSRGDRQSLMDAMVEADSSSPNISFEIKRTATQDDMVWVHSLVQKANMHIAVVHILKIKDEKIVELWDVGQVLEKDSPNEYGAI